jgi:hypothetical protein
MRFGPMTDHILQEHTEEDQLIMRRLATVVGGFVVATALLALIIGVVMG